MLLRASGRSSSRWLSVLALTASCCSVACTRWGFDARSDGGGGGVLADGPRDAPGSHERGRPGDGGSGLPTVILTLHTAAINPETFDPVVTKTGMALTWDLGDGSPLVTGNSLNHTYTLVGEKTVEVLARDGVVGITNLSINQDGLVGIIPAELGDLDSLTWLQLNDNQLSGAIPAELGDLVSLTWLSLSNNQLSGTIPAELGNLGNLTLLALSDNELSGTIPSELGDLDNLAALALQGNQLNGPIPVELGKLGSLATLTLHDNELSGSIPAELGDLGNLTLLALSGNQLSGTIPAELGQLRRLTTLILSGNRLSGAAPAMLTQLTAIEHIGLENNGMSQAAVDDIIDQIYRSRGSYDNTKAKTLDIGGTNAAPGATAQIQIQELETALHRWDISCTDHC